MIPTPSARPPTACAPDPSPAPLPFSEHTPGPQYLSCSEGPKTEHSNHNAASPGLSAKRWSFPCSCRQRYFWYKLGCHWPSWTPEHTAGSCSAKHWPIPPNLFPLHSLPATLPHACSIAWDCCGQSVGPGTWSCCTSSHWLQPSYPACPDPSVGPFYSQADQHFFPTCCHLQTYWGKCSLLTKFRQLSI